MKGQKRRGKVNVPQWAELFREGGLTDADKKMRHHLFEAKNPQGHEIFLKWLGPDAERMKTIRNQ